jgi:hypothetical protein
LTLTQSSMQSVVRELARGLVPKEWTLEVNHRFASDTWEVVLIDYTRGLGRDDVRMDVQTIGGGLTLAHAAKGDVAGLMDAVTRAIKAAVHRLRDTCLEHEDCKACAQLGAACLQQKRTANANMSCA